MLEKQQKLFVEHLRRRRCLRRKPSIKNETQITRSFTKLMFEGNTRAALQLLSAHDRGRVLNLNGSADPSNPGYLVHAALRDKHPPAQYLQQECILLIVDTPMGHPVVFDALDVCVAAPCTVGTAGPPGVDAREWRRLCTFFTQLLISFVLLLPCLLGDSVPHTSTRIFFPHSWHAV